MGVLPPASYVAHVAGWIVLELFCLFFFYPTTQSYSYGFGSSGKEKFQIPPDVELQYEVKLKSFEKVGTREYFAKLTGR